MKDNKIMITETEQNLLMMKGVISDLSAEEQSKVHKCAEQLRKLITEHENAGIIALALVGLEYSDKL